jgi:poly-gamma-glutamate capsule biosynthesis protein CapA/YwtB (metallophosphatase superfamily)
MQARPLTLAQANQLVEQMHRHHKRVQGHRFSIAAVKDDRVIGAVIVGRPVARAVDQYAVAEVTRLVTDGTPNACSFLYSRAAQAARAMGFSKIQTYILEDESGITLKAAGWTRELMTTEGHRWTNRDDRRSDQPTCRKWRWAKDLSA